MSWPGGQQPPPLNAPRAVELGVGVQPGTPNIIRARVVIIFGTADGLFVYSGTPAAGNLIASIEAVTGAVDPYGNALLPGVVSYGPFGGGTLGERLAQQSDAGTAIWYTAPSYAGPWTQVAKLTPNNTAAAGYTVLTGQPFLLPSVTAISPGTTATPESWHSATLATGWTGSIRYKLAAEVNRAWLEVNATFTDNGTTHLASGTAINGAALPTQYRPAANTPDTPVWVGGSGATIVANRVPGLRVNASGFVFVDDVTTSALNNTAIFQGEFSYPLD